MSFDLTFPKTKYGRSKRKAVYRDKISVSGKASRKTSGKFSVKAMQRTGVTQVEKENEKQKQNKVTKYNAPIFINAGRVSLPRT